MNANSNIINETVLAQHLPPVLMGVVGSQFVNGASQPEGQNSLNGRGWLGIEL